MCSLRIRGVDISNNQPAGPFQNVTFSLRTWRWDVGVCFNESNNQPSVEFIARFKDSVDKMYLSRWPGNQNGFRQWEVDQILLRFHCLFWSNNQLKDGWYFVWVSWRLHLRCGFQCCFCWLRLSESNVSNLLWRIFCNDPMRMNSTFQFCANGIERRKENQVCMCQTFIDLLETNFGMKENFSPTQHCSFSRAS